MSTKIKLKESKYYLVFLFLDVFFIMIIFIQLFNIFYFIMFLFILILKRNNIICGKVFTFKLIKKIIIQNYILLYVFSIIFF